MKLNSDQIGALLLDLKRVKGILVDGIEFHKNNKIKTWGPYQSKGLCLLLYESQYLKAYRPWSVVLHMITMEGWWWKRGKVNPRLRYVNNLIQYLEMKDGFKKKLFWIYITLFS
jgi:hypothetical protein